MDTTGKQAVSKSGRIRAEEQAAAQQREALLRHARAIINAGGEDVLAVGSDFDGIPPNAYIPDPSYMPRFLSDLAGAVGTRAAEKAARDNVLRLFSDVCG